MSDIKKLIGIVHEAAKEFGAVFPEDKKEKPNIVVNAIERNVIDTEKVNVRFYAIIDETQPTGGVYSGLSFVIFPDSEGERCIVSIACGIGGIENDSELASLPGLRRGVLRIQKQHNKEYKDKGKPVMSCKRNFTDIENKIKFTNAKNDKNFKAASKEYGKYILASQEVFINEEESVTILKAWLALYAKYREWGKDDNISSALDRYYKGNDDTTIIQTEISKLLSRRKFVVLQGAPGTGKTWIASKIAKEGLDDNIKFSEIIFTQFHAETTYTDFISGIIPAAEKKRHEC